MDLQGYILHPDLDKILKAIEAKGYKIKITDWGRTFAQHVAIYKRDLGKNFSIDKVPMDSRHLPCFKTIKLRAVDFAVLDAGGHYLTGFEIYDLIKKVKGAAKVGTGITRTGRWIHLDTDREQDTVWYYS